MASKKRKQNQAKRPMVKRLKPISAQAEHQEEQVMQDQATVNHDMNRPIDEAPVLRPRTTLLDLPGEILNRIFGYCVLFDEVPIVSHTPTGVRSYGNVDLLPADFRHYWTDMEARGKPIQYRTSWEISPMEFHRKYVASSVWGRTPLPRHSSGGFHPYRSSYVKESWARYVNANLFLVNRKIYEVASTLFFERNHFAFRVAWEDAHFAPRAFLQDHDRAYHWLRSLQIELERKPLFVGREHGHSIQHVVPSNMGWNLLIKEIRKMNLRHFGLSFPVELRGLHDLYAYPPWLEDSARIKGLKSMNVICALDDINSIVVMNQAATFTSPLISICEFLRDKWLSGEGSAENTSLHEFWYGVGSPHLEFRAWVPGHPQRLMPLKDSDKPNLEYVWDRTERYQRGDYKQDVSEGTFAGLDD